MWNVKSTCELLLGPDHGRGQFFVVNAGIFEESVQVL
jgi:hypothetical protein